MPINSQLHFDQVSRHFLDQRREHVGVSADEIVDLLGSSRALGIWRLEIDTGHIYWTEDAARIHGMEKSDGPVSLSQIMARYHPEDAELVEQVLGSATAERHGFSFVMRVKSERGCYRLTGVAGGYRENNGGEFYGFCYEFQEMVRSIVMMDD